MSYVKWLISGDHEGGPDGMDFDASGNLLVANWGSGFIDVRLHESTCCYCAPINMSSALSDCSNYTYSILIITHSVILEANSNNSAQV